ncbi:hypothetical protein ACP70R_035783 [Stipagrostis hirtigluma subsp. patula]
MAPLVLHRLLVLVVAACLAAASGADSDDARYDPSMCKTSLRCGDSVDLHYPFFLANATSAIDGYTAAPSYCGYPGMGILCDGGRATLRLGGDSYAVLGIDYVNHTVTLADAAVLGGGEDCPRVTHNVTVPSNTWLSPSPAVNDDLAFFFGCDFTGPNATSPPPEIPPINCSGFPERDGVSFVVPGPDVPQQEWPRACKTMVVVPVLKDRLLSSLPRLNGDGYGRVLKQGFQLSWDPSAGPCLMCEDSKGQCSYNQTGGFLGCLCSDGRVRNPDCVAAGSGGFNVTSVDYDNHLLTLVDQSLADQSCVQPYQNTTINNTMFMYTDRDQFLRVYINCSAKSSQFPDVYDIFSCFSGGRTYYRLDNGTMAPDFLGSCTSTLVLPYNSAMAGSLAAGNSSLGDVIRGGFSVKWTAGMGWCGDCKYSGGRCGYNGSYPSDHTCFCPDGPSSGSCSSGLKKSSKKAIAIGASVAAGVFFLLLVVVSCLYIRKRRQYKMTSSSRLLKYTASGGTPRSKCSGDMDSGSVHDLQTPHFTYEELEEATEGFNGAREIGDGGFGTVYKGHLRDGRVVAVKRLYNNSFRRVEQFLNEAAILSRLRHPNLVMFYGCTSSRSRELLLVYEFVPNGTVADHLHGHRAPERALAWPLRLNIAVEAAAALAYLHAVEPPVVHRDVKTNNILLDANFHVKVADFGLSRLFPVDVTHVSTAPQGTPGYVDPEYHQCYQLTDKSDVYSFGVVLVELVSSKPAVDITRDRNEINLAGMAINKIQRRELEQLVDMELGYGSDEATTKAMTMVAELAFRCLQQNGEMRPPIREVLAALRSIQEEGLEKKDALLAPRSPDTVHAPWDSMSTTPSVSQSDP